MNDLSIGFFLERLDDPAPFAAELVSHGVSAVQIGWDPLARMVQDPTHARQVAEAFATAGAPLVALGGYRNLVAHDEQRRRQNVNYLKDCLRLAADLGVPAVSTETGTRNPESDWQPHPLDQTSETWDLLVSGLEELIETAEQVGATLALEGYVNNVVGRVEQVAELLDRFRSPALGLVCDPYNYVSKALVPRQAEVLGDLFRLSDRFVMAHLKDVVAEGAEVNTPEFGTGVFDQSAYLILLRTTRPDLVPILEHMSASRLPDVLRRVRKCA
jgi:sugar phosphate isomerase/epimerase